MSDDLQKALARIAALEEKASAKNAAPQFDANELIKNPIGFLQKHGVPIDHVGKYVIAHQLGDAAPDGIKAYVQMGQQVSATHELKTQIEDLRRGLDSVVGGTKREKFDALLANKGQYPHLAAVVAANPTFVGEVQGDPAEYAAKLEATLAALKSAATPQPASAANAATHVAEGQAKPAPMAGTIAGDPPALTKVPDGPLDAAGKKALLEEVLRLHPSQ